MEIQDDGIDAYLTELQTLGAENWGCGEYPALSHLYAVVKRADEVARERCF